MQRLSLPSVTLNLPPLDEKGCVCSSHSSLDLQFAARIFSSGCTCCVLSCTGTVGARCVLSCTGTVDARCVLSCTGTVGARSVLSCTGTVDARCVLRLPAGQRSVTIIIIIIIIIIVIGDGAVHDSSEVLHIIRRGLLWLYSCCHPYLFVRYD